MLLSKLRFIMAVVLLTVALGMGAVGLLEAMAQPPQAQADPPNRQNAAAGDWASTLLAERFAETHKLIRPQPGESRWSEIPWQTSLWEARKLAAAAGKPMFVWSGSGGAPCAPT